MKKILKTRESGKTWNICQLAIEKQANILVPHANQAKYTVRTLKKILESQGYLIVAIVLKDNSCSYVTYTKNEEIFTIRVYAASHLAYGVSGIRGLRSQRILIDDAEWFLSAYFQCYGITTEGISVSLDD